MKGRIAAAAAMAMTAGALVLVTPVRSEAAVPTTASLAGGDGTALVNGRLYARSGAPLTLSVSTPSSARCVTVTGALAAAQTSSTGRTAWTVPLTAGTGDGARALTVTAYAKVDRKGCSTTAGTASASYAADNTVPSLSPAVAPGPGATGWIVGDATVAWTAADGGSGLAAGPDPTTELVDRDGTTTATSTAIDRVGNKRTASIAVQRDATLPALTASVPAPNAAGWYTGDVPISWACSDATSGISSCPAPTLVTGEGASLSAAATVADVAGNVRTTSVDGLRIDRTPPVTSASVADTDPSHHVVTLDASDALSGVAATTYTIDGGAPVDYTAPFAVDGPGSHVVTWWSTDRAGNAEAPASQTVASPPDHAVIEGETLAPALSPVADGQATGGSAVTVGSYASAPAGVVAGTYALTARVRSTRSCALLAVDDKTVARFPVTGGAWQTVTVPVAIGGPGSTVGVMNNWCIDKLGTDPLVLDWMSLAPTGPQLTTRGTQIIGRSGAPFVPRGVNRNGYELYPKGYWASDYDFWRMSQADARIVRLQLSEVFWLPSSCQYDPDYASRVDAAVRSITGRGMVALLDLHTNTTGSTCETGTPHQQKMADAQSPEFWREVAGRYRDNPLVAFDLYNEPHDIPVGVWRNGGTVDGWQAAGMQQLYDAVRSTGATNLVFVSGTDWAHTLTQVVNGQGLYGYGIVYAAHVYNNADCGPLPSWLDTTVTPATSKVPVAITEFGTQCDTGGFDASVVSYAASHGLGWMGFAWNAAGPGSWSLLASWDTYAPSPAGQPVFDGLRAAASQPGA